MRAARLPAPRAPRPLSAQPRADTRSAALQSVRDQQSVSKGDPGGAAPAEPRSQAAGPCQGAVSVPALWVPHTGGAGVGARVHFGSSDGVGSAFTQSDQ
ncbi:Hypothetical predicted protein [Marmota monax]|uniref:Uncharacterized protein n=1 Tax=Marmota monax TaxID=9995 RepID=A0A5E4ATL6_MARMO|nr:Hypothetical predicted protein [Marmota monax]